MSCVSYGTSKTTGCVVKGGIGIHSRASSMLFIYISKFICFQEHLDMYEVLVYIERERVQAYRNPD